MTDNFFLDNITYIALIIIAIVTYKRWYNKKHGIEEEETKPTKFNQSYFYKVFVERVKDRPNTHYFVFIFFVATFILLNIINIYWVSPLLKFEELSIEEGVIIDVKIVRRGNNTITLLDSNNEKKVFTITRSKGLSEKILDKKVIVYYQNKWQTIGFFNHVYDISIDDTLIFDYQNNYYANSLGDKEKTVKWIVFCMFAIGISILFIWFMNRKELPIHIQNREKRLNKKDKLHPRG